jgi:hypothetical protein
VFGQQHSYSSLFAWNVADKTIRANTVISHKNIFPLKIMYLSMNGVIGMIHAHELATLV